MNSKSPESASSATTVLDRPHSEILSDQPPIAQPHTAKDPFAGLSPMPLTDTKDMNPGLDLGNPSTMTRASLDEQYQSVAFPAQEPSDTRVPLTPESSTPEQKKKVYTVYAEGGASKRFADLKAAAKILQKEYVLEHTKYEVHWDTKDIGRQEGEKKLAYAGRLAKKFLPQMVPNGYKMLINALPWNSIDRYVAQQGQAESILKRQVAMYMDMHQGQLPTKLSELPELVTKQQKEAAFNTYKKYEGAANANAPYEKDGELQFYDGLGELSALVENNKVAKEMSTMITASVNTLADRLLAIEPDNIKEKERILYEERQKMNRDFWTFAGTLEEAASYQDAPDSDAKAVLDILNTAGAKANDFVDGAVKTAERIAHDERASRKRINEVVSHKEREIQIITVNLRTKAAQDAVSHIIYDKEYTWIGTALDVGKGSLVYGRSATGVIATGIMAFSLGLGLAPVATAAGGVAVGVGIGAGVARVADTVSNVIRERKGVEEQVSSGSLSLDTAPQENKLVAGMKLFTEQGRQESIARNKLQTRHITRESEWRTGSLSMDDDAVQQRQYSVDTYADVMQYITSDRDQGYISLESIHAGIKEAKTPEEKQRALIAAVDRIGLLRASLRLENFTQGSWTFIEGSKMHIIAEMAQLQEAIETNLQPDAAAMGELLKLFTKVWEDIKGEDLNRDKNWGRIADGARVLLMAALTGATAWRMYEYGQHVAGVTHTGTENAQAQLHHQSAPTRPLGVESGPPPVTEIPMFQFEHDYRISMPVTWSQDQHEWQGFNITSDGRHLTFTDTLGKDDVLVMPSSDGKSTLLIKFPEGKHGFSLDTRDLESTSAVKIWNTKNNTWENVSTATLLKLMGTTEPMAQTATGGVMSVKAPFLFGRRLSIGKLLEDKSGHPVSVHITASDPQPMSYAINDNTQIAKDLTHLGFHSHAVNNHDTTDYTTADNKAGISDDTPQPKEFRTTLELQGHKFKLDLPDNWYVEKPGNADNYVWVYDDNHQPVAIITKPSSDVSVQMYWMEPDDTSSKPLIYDLTFDTSKVAGISVREIQGHAIEVSNINTILLENDWQQVVFFPDSENYYIDGNYLMDISGDKIAMITWKNNKLTFDGANGYTGHFSLDPANAGFILSKDVILKNLHKVEAPANHASAANETFVPVGGWLANIGGVAGLTLITAVGIWATRSYRRDAGRPENTQTVQQTTPPDANGGTPTTQTGGASTPVPALTTQSPDQGEDEVLPAILINPAQKPRSGVKNVVTGTGNKIARGFETAAVGVGRVAQSVRDLLPKKQNPSGSNKKKSPQPEKTPTNGGSGNTSIFPDDSEEAAKQAIADYEKNHPNARFDSAPLVTDDPLGSAEGDEDKNNVEFNSPLDDWSNV